MQALFFLRFESKRMGDVDGVAGVISGTFEALLTVAHG
jgi:hypothetical protein